MKKNLYISIFALCISCSSDPAKKSNREFNEELERQQREQEQARGTPLTGQGSTVNTQEQIQASI